MRLVGQACFVLLLKIRLLNSRTNTQSHAPTVEQRGGVDGQDEVYFVDGGAAGGL